MPSRAKHRRISKGIYRDAYGLRAVVNSGKGRAEKRYPFDTPLDTIRAWRKEEASKLSTRKAKPGTTTLKADVETYLESCSLASKASRRSDLLAWVERHPDLQRGKLTKAHAEKALKAWALTHKPWTIRHRVQALRSLYRALDGEDAPTPVDRLKLGKKPRGQPVFVPAGQISSVADNLTRWPQTRARHLVLCSHGVRACELMRALPTDVNLEANVWPVRSAKGGIARVLHLNAPHMLAAWQAFIEANAWGDYDTTQHARRLRKAGWPEGLRPSKVRGTWGMDLSRRGVSLRVIQELLGHANIETTAVYYVAPDDSEVAAATKRTEGRF